jgi:hypothetical protein
VSGVFEAGAIQGRISLDMRGWTSNVRRAMSDARDLRAQLAKNGQAAKEFGLQLSLAAGAAASAFGLMLKSAMAAQEAENLVDVSFKGMADSVRAWSEEVGDSMRVSASEIRNQAATLNLMINSMGLAERASIEMSKNLTKLAYDLASLRNISIEEAFEKLKSGITGETEPLKALGITLLESQVQAFAFANGIAKAGEDLSETQKIVARYGLILERTKTDQGDMARTWNSATNLSRSFRSQISELSKEMGQRLIPSYSEFMQTVNGSIIGLRDFAKTHGDIVDSFIRGAAEITLLVVGFGALVGALKVASVAYKGLAAAAAIANAVMLGTPALVVGALALVGAAVYSLAALWRKNFLGIRYATGEAVKFIVDAFNSIGRPILAALGSLANDYLKWLTFLLNSAKWVVNRIIGVFNAIPAAVAAIFETGSIDAAIVRFGNALFHRDFIGDALDGIGGAVKGWAKDISADLGLAFEGITAALTAGGEGITAALPAAGQAIVDTTKEDFAAFLGWLRGQAPEVTKIVEDLFSALRGAGQTGKGAFEGYGVPDFAALLEGATGAAAAAGKAGKDSAAKKAEKEAKAAAKAFEQLQEKGKSLFLQLSAVDGILAQVADSMEALKAVGKWDDTTRSLFAVELWKSMEDMSAAASENIINRIGKIDAGLSDAIRRLKTKAVAEAEKAQREIEQSLLRDLPELDFSELDRMREYFKQSSDLGGWAGLHDNITRVGSALNQLPGKFQKVAKAAEIAGDIIALAMAPDPVSKAIAAIKLLGDALSLFGEKTEEVKKGWDRVMEEIGNSIDGWIDSLTDAIVEFVKTGKASFKDFVDSVLEDLLKITIKYGVIYPLLEGFGISPNAKGNVFQAGNIVPFWQGGVVTQATAFPMRGRKLGLMGEAGPEAIMPLKRMAGGALGVQAAGAGGGTVVNVIDQRSGGDPPPEVKRSVRPDGREQIDVVVKGAVDRLAAQGRLDSTMRRNYRVERIGTRRS